MNDQVDFAAKFYVRLEDSYKGLLIWDVTPVDGYSFDMALDLRARLIESNILRLKGER